MKLSQRFLALAFLSSLFVLAASITRGQTSRGTLTGTVTDISGAVIAKASVSIKQVGTNVTRQTLSNEAGIYRFDAVDLGTYILTVQASGFSKQETMGVEIEAAHTTNIDVSLKVGATAETVTVEASPEVVLQTAEQVRGANFADRSIDNLPITGQDSLTLAQLLPGITVINQSASNSINQNGTFAFSVNGQRPRSNNFMIDGVENNDISIAGPAYTITNPDAVEEVNIQTADFSAEFGRAGGAVLNQITKSGSNTLHGTATTFTPGVPFLHSATSRKSTV
jgi:hypothetical protein